MTDPELIAQLKNSKGWPTLGKAAADRLEALIEELNTCRMAQAVMDNTVAGLKDELNLVMAERGEAWRRAAHAEKMWGEAEVKLAKAVDALEYYAVEALPWEADDSLRARTTLAEIKGASIEHL